MAYGFFVIEQRKAAKPGAPSAWTPVHHPTHDFDARTTLTKVMKWIEPLA